jgi:CRISPR-associated protein Cas5h
MEILSFDVYGDYGHFRKFYTTSSPLTFSTMPPTAVYGLLGAILGLSKEDNQYLLEINSHTTKIAIQVLNPIKKVHIGINHLNTKNHFWAPKTSKGARTQIRTEFLKAVGFRIYVQMNSKRLFTQLVEMVREHQSIYTICLGLSELLADFSFHNVQEGTLRTNPEWITTQTVIPISLIHEQKISIEAGLQILKEKQPINMNNNREVLQYESLLFDFSGNPITAVIREYVELTETGEKIVFCN